MTTRTWGVVFAVGAALLLSACGADGLEGDDPKGYKACSDFEKFRADGQVDLDEAGAVGISAAEATTDIIREGAKPLMDKDMLQTLRKSNPKVEQIYLINRDEFAAACADAGYRFQSD